MWIGRPADNQSFKKTNVQCHGYPAWRPREAVDLTLGPDFGCQCPINAKLEKWILRQVQIKCNLGFSPHICNA